MEYTAHRSCGYCGEPISSGNRRAYCDSKCRTQAFSERRRQRNMAHVPSEHRVRRWLHCPTCGLMSPDERFKKVHAVAAKIQRSRSAPGVQGGWEYTTERPTADELELLRVAADAAE